MTWALLWKEYRQQRVIWLAIAILAVLLTVLLAATLGHGSGAQAYADPGLQQILNIVLFCLVVTYGIVAGALLLAAEKEDGTLAFLDNQTGRRTPSWLTKVGAGVAFTLLQGLTVMALAVVLGFDSWEVTPFLPLAGLEALAWGLVGGALCRTVLTAVLAGIVFMAGTWTSSLLSTTLWPLVLIRVGFAVMAYYASWRVFCRDDSSRRPTAGASELPAVRLMRGRRVLSLSVGWRALAWLAWRQGRWVLVGGLVGVLWLGCVVNWIPIVPWPLGTLLLGLAFGLATFAPDQKEGSQFLGSQRIPPAAMWDGKVFLWGLATIGVMVLAWFVATVFVWRLIAAGFLPMAEHLHDGLEHWGEPNYWAERWLAGLYLPADTIWWGDLQLPVNNTAALFVGIWPLYGFTFGQFFAMVARRPVIAAILSASLAIMVLALYLPSLVFGGVNIWWVLPIPALLLLTTHFGIRPWLSRRLLTGWSFLGIVTATGLIALALVAFIRHRTTEVPDVGDPFDVSEFTAGLPSPDKDKAGPLLRRAAALFKERDEQVRKLPPVSISRPGEDSLIEQVVKNGWPREDHAIRRWLDLYFRGDDAKAAHDLEWVQQAQTAARLPLGLVLDPRHTRITDSFQPVLYFQSMGELFAARALRRQADGDSRGGLDDLETALGLARQVKHDAPALLFRAGDLAERSALFAFRSWLQKVGGDKELLRRALFILRRHEAAAPGLATSVKAQYLVELASGPVRWEHNPLAEGLLLIAYEVPWERERQLRIFRAVYLGRLLALEEPPMTALARLKYHAEPYDRYSWAAVRVGLPTPTGPGSELAAARWGQLVLACRLSSGNYGPELQIKLVQTQRWLHAAQLATAAALYQAERGKPPQTLKRLVPMYLPAIPIDPITNEPFRYRRDPGLIRCPAWPNYPLSLEDSGRFTFPVPVRSK